MDKHQLEVLGTPRKPNPAPNITDPAPSSGCQVPCKARGHIRTSLALVPRVLMAAPLISRPDNASLQLPLVHPPRLAVPSTSQPKA